MTWNPEDQPLQSEPPTEAVPYRLTLIDGDGALMSTVELAMYGPPRFVHVELDPDKAESQTATLTDDPAPPMTPHHVETFARVASAVWHPEGRDALYVRQP